MSVVQSPPSRGARSRRTNAERSSATRTLILEATVDCLYRQGYGAVTNHQVAALAGVSRGAMMHHFPTRVDLLVAVVRFAYDRNRQTRIDFMETLPPGLPRYYALVDLAWQTASSPEGLALNEVRVGARSDPEVASAVAPVTLAISNDYARFLGKTMKGAGLEPDDRLRGVFASISMATRALSIDRFTHPRPETVEQVLSTLRRLCAEEVRRLLPDADI